VPCVLRPLFAIALFLGGTASRADGFCAGERERAQATVQRIEREWPLRASGDAISAYMQSLVEQLARRSNRNGVPWRVNVVRNRAANAFAVGGGHIYVTDGTLAFVEDESEIAAILAHEMGHQLSGHFCRQGPAPSLWGGLFGGAGGAPAARTRGVGSLSLVVDLVKEQEADRRALDLLKAGGYNPQAMLEVAKRLPSGGSSAHLQDPRRTHALENSMAGRSAIRTASSEEFHTTKRKLEKELADW